MSFFWSDVGNGLKDFWQSNVNYFKDGIKFYKNIGQGIGNLFNGLSSAGNAVGGLTQSFNDVLNSDAWSGLGDALSGAVGDIESLMQSPDLYRGLQNYLTGDLDFQRELEMLRRNQEFTRETNDLAYQRQRELRQTQYQDTAQSLQAAGFNPILALSGGIAGTPSVSSSTGSGGSHSGGSGAGSAQMLTALAHIFGSAFSLANSVSDRANKRSLAKDEQEHRQKMEELRLSHTQTTRYYDRNGELRGGSVRHG